MDSFHGPAVVASLIRSAYEEGAARGLADGYAESKAKRAADQILTNAGDPTRVERFFGLFRAWAASYDGDNHGAGWKRASGLMKQMRELVGDAPFDGGGNEPIV